MTVDVQTKIMQNQPAHDISTDDETGSEAEENAGNAGQFDHISNRNEKKAREILAKLGMKPIANIERVTLKRSKNVRALPGLYC